MAIELVSEGGEERLPFSRRQVQIVDDENRRPFVRQRMHEANEGGGKGIRPELLRPDVGHLPEERAQEPGDEPGHRSQVLLDGAGQRALAEEVANRLSVGAFRRDAAAGR